MSRIKIRRKPGGKGQARKSNGRRSKTHTYLNPDGSPVDPDIPIPAFQGARPIKPTTRVVDIICAALLNGNHKSTAAMVAGISYDTMKEWERKGSEASVQKCKTQDELDEILPYAEARFKIASAIAQYEANAVAGINEAGANGDWRAHAWALERRFRSRFAKTKKLEIKGHVHHEHSDMQKMLEDPDTAEAVLEEFEDSVATTDGLEPGEDPSILDAEIVK